MALLTWTISLFTYFFSQVEGHAYKLPINFFLLLSLFENKCEKIIGYVVKCVPYKLILP